MEKKRRDRSIIIAFLIPCRTHDDPNFLNSKIYLPPELQIAPPKKASTVGGGGIGSGLVKVSALKSFSGASMRGKGGRRGRPPKQDVSSQVIFFF